MRLLNLRKYCSPYSATFSESRTFVSLACSSVLSEVFLLCRVIANLHLQSHTMTGLWTSNDPPIAYSWQFSKSRHLAGFDRLGLTSCRYERNCSNVAFWPRDWSLLKAFSASLTVIAPAGAVGACQVKGISVLDLLNQQQSRQNWKLP